MKYITGTGWMNGRTPFDKASVGRGYARPSKGDYQNEEDWLVATTQHYLSVNRDRFNYIHSQQQESVNMYNRVFGQFPGTGQPDNLRQEATPGKIYYHLNKIFGVLRQNVGRRKSRRMDVTASAVNADAESRMQTHKGLMFLNEFFKASYPKLYDGIINGMWPKYDPNSGLELHNYADKTYRDKYAQAAERIMMSWVKSSGFYDWLISTYIHYWLTETAIAFVDVDPETLKVDLALTKPMSAIWDMDSTSDVFSDQQYLMRVNYLPVTEVMRRWPKIKIEDIEKYVGSDSSMAYLPFAKGNNDGKQMILVTEIRFLYNEDLSIDIPDGFEVTLDEVTGEIKASTNKKQKVINAQEAYEATIIAGNIMVSGGKMPYQARSIDNLGKANLRAEVLKLDQNISPYSPPLPIRVKALQDEINQVFAKMLSIMHDTQAPFIEINPMALSLAGYEGRNEAERYKKAIEDVISTRVVVLDADQITLTPGSEMPPPIRFTGHDPTGPLPALVNQFNLLLNEFREMLNWNAAMQGQVSQYASGSNISAIQQQVAEGMAYRESMFDDFVSRTLTLVCNTIKSVLMAHKKDDRIKYVTQKIRATVGDLTYDIFESDEMTLQDYQIEIEMSLSEAEYRQRVELLIQMGAQQGTLDPLDIAILSDIPDPKRALAEIKKTLAKKSEQKAAAEMAAAEQQAAMKQAELATQQQVAGVQAQAQLQKTAMNNDAALEKEIIKSTTK